MYPLLPTYPYGKSRKKKTRKLKIPTLELGKNSCPTTRNRLGCYLALRSELRIMFGTFAIKETKRRNWQRISVVWYDIGYVRIYIYRYKYILQLAEPSLFEHIQYTTVIFLKKKGAHLPKSFFIKGYPII